MATKEKYNDYANDAYTRASQLEADHRRSGRMLIGSKVNVDAHNHVQNLRQSEAEDQRERQRRNRDAANGKKRLTTDDKRL